MSGIEMVRNRFNMCFCRRTPELGSQPGGGSVCFNDLLGGPSSAWGTREAPAAHSAQRIHCPRVLGFGAITVYASTMTLNLPTSIRFMSNGIDAGAIFAIRGSFITLAFTLSR